MSSYLWQNFLADEVVLQAITEEVKGFVEAANPTTLIEIWPGKWALTKHIQNLTQQTILVEFDEKLVHYLQHHDLLADHTTIINEDVLKRDPTKYQVAEKSLIVWNLPYYITSPILRKFFEKSSPDRLGGVFLIQKEVAQKLEYSSSKKSFLWWLINYSYRVEYCFDVPAAAFDPAPKVTSSVIRITPKDKSTIPELDFDRLRIFLDLYNQFKRKTLWKSAKILTKQWRWEEFDISSVASRRLEELTWDDLKDIL